MLRRLFLLPTACVAFAGSTFAADLPYRGAPTAYAAPVPIFTWTGLYLGGQIGYGWGADRFSGSSPGYAFSGTSYTPNGVVGGAHVGYNYQFNQFVAGLEGDVEGSSFNRSYGFGPVTYGTQLPVQGSIRARAGLALDRALLYVTGGGAFASFTNTYSSFLGYNSIGKSLAGWTIGGGLEYAVTNNWSIRAEYRYADFGSFTDYPVAAAPRGAVSHHEVENAIRAGFSYRFDSLLPPAPTLTQY